MFALPVNLMIESEDNFMTENYFLKKRWNFDNYRVRSIACALARHCQKLKVFRS